MFKFLSQLFSRGMPVVHRQEQLSGHAADTPEEDSEHLLVLRRVVLTRDKKVAGYAFLQREDAGNPLIEPKQAQAFLTFLESSMATGMLGKRRAFASISERLLFDPLLEKLAHAGVIVLVRFDPGVNDLAPVIERMQTMRHDGMTLGLADARDALVHPALGHCAKLGFLPVDQMIMPDLLESVRLLIARHPRLQLCASGVNSLEEFEVCHRLGMQGFIGPFVSHRRDWQNNIVDPGTLHLYQLVNDMRAGAEMDTIVQTIKRDPLLSYRILCHANSAAIGSERKILALKDAILLIGREPLFRWLVLLLCASAPSLPESDALLETALVRGRTLEMLAVGISTAPPENFFLTGVLSLLDVVLQLPAPALYDALGLPDDIRSALQARKGPYASLLQLVEASEQGRPEGLHDLCTGLGIEPRRLSQVQTEALIWARGQTQGDADDAAFVTEQPTAGAAQDTQPPIQPENQAAVANQAPADQQACAHDSLFEAAQAGDSAAQCALGDRFANGDGVAQDLAKSLAYYVKAAEQGHAKAQWNVAVIQGHVHGATHRDLELAARWCQKAAEQGFAPAQATLGTMYAMGQGVEKNLHQAMALFEQAGDQGDSEAQYNLAVVHEQGLAGEKNLAQALVWFAKAAQQGLPAAQERLGLMYAIGQPMAQDLSEAYKWFLIASESKLDSAKINLSHCLSLMEPDKVIEAESRARLWMQDHANTHASTSKAD